MMGSSGLMTICVGQRALIGADLTRKRLLENGMFGRRLVEEYIGATGANQERCRPERYRLDLIGRGRDCYEGIVRNIGAMGNRLIRKL